MARKILLADDSVTAQNMGRKILADAGYEVITVNNGSAALKKVAEARPDVIVLDVYMPGYSGLEVCQRLKEVPETARIPILLTVGKLEPFKPEEAKRAKADGFIVKPFEASELLSALSKLEDKIVPRPEPSKPGRFARAIAAVEEGRYDKSMAVEEDSGWKERISFPSKKKSKVVEPEDGDDPAIYNPLNKDLRTVIDHPHAHPPQAVRPEDPRMNLGALAPHGLPKDVTPEEIAALAAAAARMKGTGSGEREPEGRVADTQPAENRTAQEHVSEGRFFEEQVRPPQATEPAPQPPVAAQAAVTEVTPAEKPLEDNTEGKQEEPAVEPSKEVAAAPAAEAVAEQKPEETKAEVPAEKPSEAEKKVPSFAAMPDPDATISISVMGVPVPIPFANFGSGNSSSAYLPADEPVTMAAAAGAEFASSESRWMAVPVSLLPEESAISLEQEMQKNFAALAAAEMAHAAPPEPAAETQPGAVMASPVEAPVAEPPAPAPVTSTPEVAETPAPVTAMPEVVETPAPVTSTPEVVETMSSVASEAAEAIQAAVKEFETVAAQLAEVQPAAAHQPEPAPVQTAQPVAELAPEPVAEPVVEAPPAGEAKAEEKVEEKIEAKVEDKPVVESAAPEREAKQEEARAQDVPQPESQEQEAKKTEEPQPQVETVAAAPAEISSSAETSETTAPLVASEVPAEPTLARQDSPQITEAPAQAGPAAGGIEDMAKKEKEIAATTAAAWASWRRIRETGDGKAEPPAKAEQEPPAPDQAAMAVAAGAEKAPEEAPAESGSESAEIASIVDSVLADLRPKIVEEISRKMGKKKK